MLCELTNMCMITDPIGRVLVQDKLPKTKDTWSGLTFPGGHVEPGESIVASVIREVHEETGLTISNVEQAGFVQWYNPEKQLQYLVFLFKTNSYTGELHPSHEGEIRWMPLEEMLMGKLAPNMKTYIEVFRNPSIPQVFGISGNVPALIDNKGKVVL